MRFLSPEVALDAHRRRNCDARKITTFAGARLHSDTGRRSSAVASGSLQHFRTRGSGSWAVTLGSTFIWLFTDWLWKVFAPKK